MQAMTMAALNNKCKQSVAGTLLTVLLLSSMLLNGVNAWGYVAHRVVAGLAERYLSQASWEWTHKIQNDRDATLVDICVQADEYGYSENGGWSLPLHYVNSPLDATSFDLERDCGAAVEYKCVVSAIMNYTRILEKLVQKDIAGRLSTATDMPQVPPRQAVSDEEWTWQSAFEWEGPEPTPLAFLVHFVSDIGQPLHAGFSCDRGGNDVITMQTWQPSGELQMYNLHRIWDSTIVELVSDSWEQWVHDLYNLVEDNPSHWWAQANMTTTATQLATWAFQLATGNVYWFDVTEDDPVVTTHRNYPDHLANLCPLELPVLTQGYFNHSLPIIRSQLILSGLRLATHLNNIFTVPPRD